MGKVVVLDSFGIPEVLRLVDRPDEEPSLGEVRLRIHSIGLNRTELTLRSGRSPQRPTLPSRIGFEAAGVIDEVGPDVEGFSKGDRVALVPTYGASRYGLYAETSLAPAKSLVKLESDTTFDEAAATWVAFGTAWCGLIDAGRLSAAQTVAITAASSSVGLAAIQVAKSVGARVIAITRTEEKSQRLLNHGADAVIVSQEHEVDSQLQRLTDGAGVDLVLDAVGGPQLAKLSKGTRNGGTLLLYGALDSQVTTVSPFDIFGRGINLRGFALPLVAAIPDKFDALTHFVQAGIANRSFRPMIAKTFPLAEIVNAHRFLESGEYFGKVIVTTG